MDDQPAVSNNTSAHRFEIQVWEHLAFAEYRLQDDSIVFTHTLVPEALGGRGLGGQLAKAALAYAAESRLKVVLQCSFFVSYLAKHPEYAHLLESGPDAA
jgi:predicted GNAT family acetyltransferase